MIDDLFDVGPTRLPHDDSFKPRVIALYSRLGPDDRYEGMEWRVSTDVAVNMRRSVGAPDKARPGDVQQCFGIPLREIEDAPAGMIELWKRVQ